MSAPHIRYNTIAPAAQLAPADDVLSQYHAIAAATILFYDYLLTLADEVCWGSFLRILSFPTQMTFYSRSNMLGLEINLGVSLRLETDPTF